MKLNKKNLYSMNQQYEKMNCCQTSTYSNLKILT